MITFRKLQRSGKFFVGYRHNDVFTRKNRTKYAARNNLSSRRLRHELIVRANEMERSANR